MSIVVYWLSNLSPHCQVFTDEQLLAALAFAEARRKDRDQHGASLNSHVVIHSELGDCVSKPGVSDERPSDYSWTKAHRGGPPSPEGHPKTLG